jgi:hypothetical protein
VAHVDNFETGHADHECLTLRLFKRFLVNCCLLRGFFLWFVDVLYTAGLKIAAVMLVNVVSCGFTCFTGAT